MAICRGAHHQVSSLAFSPDGMDLASSGRGPTRLWDVATGRPLLDMAEGDHVGALAFSETGKWLAVSANHGDPTGRVYVWEIRNGRGVQQLRGLASGITKVAMSMDGSLLAALGMGWEVGVWDSRRGVLQHRLHVARGFSADNAAIALSPSGRRLAYASGDEAQLWDLTSGRLTNSWRLPGGFVDVLAFPDEDALFLFRVELRQGTKPPTSDVLWTDNPRVCRIRNLLGTAPLRPLREIAQLNVHVFSAAASSDGRFFAADGIGEAGTRRYRGVLAVESRSGPRFGRPRPNGGKGGATFFFSPDGARLVFAADDAQWQQVSLGGASLKKGRRYPPIMALGASERHWIAGGSAVGRDVGASLDEGARLAGFGVAASPAALCMQFSRGGRFIAWGAADGIVRLADLSEVESHLTGLGVERRL